jgi:hypothetical protein
MMRTFLGGLAGLLLFVPAASAADSYSIKEAKTAPPKALKDSVRKLLEEKSVQFLNNGKLVAEIWFRKEIPAKATDAQIKNGLTYQEVPQTTLFGALELKDTLTDFRKQKIKAGVYTMRLAYQPMDGDHMGTAPFGEFVLFTPAGDDDGKETLEPEKLIEQGKKASGTGHPAVFLLFPVGKKDMNKPPALAKQMGNNWVLSVTRPTAIGGKVKGVLGIGLTLVGVSPSA